jgi:AraC-like DNA-binding protein
MTIQLYSKFHNPIALNDTTAGVNDVRIMPNAKCLTAKEEGNEFLFQELQGDGFTVRLSSFKIEAPTSFIITYPFRICFQISLFQTTHYELAGYGAVHLHQRRYNILAVPSFSAQYKLSTKALLLPFEICFTQEFLEPFRNTYRQLDEFIKQAEKARPVALFDASPIASTEMLAMIDLIIECGKDSSWDPDYLNIYVLELLHYALKQKLKPKRVKSPQDVINRLYQAEQLLIEFEERPGGNGVEAVLNPISTNITEANNEESTKQIGWSIKELAKCADMSLYAFTKLFKEVFGQSVMNYRKEIIWQAVLVLILRAYTNLKTITSIAEYNDQPSFSRAFKKRFGFTPSEFVQKFSKKIADYKKNANTN